MHFESSGPESQFSELSAGYIDSTEQVLIFLYILKDKDDKEFFVKYFDNKSFNKTKNHQLTSKENKKI